VEKREKKKQPHNNGGRRSSLIEGGSLPHEFWLKNEFGICGGVEFGFLSTTTNPEVAKTYAQGTDGRAATVFEIKMGMVDRGADISVFSQYPHEKEICFLL